MLQKSRVLERRFELEKFVLEGMGNMMQEVFKMGLALKEIRDDKLWRTSHAKFDDYCRDTFGYGKSWAYGLVSLYDKFYLVAKTHPENPVDISRMYKLLPHVTEENAEEMYLMAAGTNWTGFENNIKNLKNRKGTDECDEHQWVTINVCLKCGFREKVQAERR